MQVSPRDARTKCLENSGAAHHFARAFLLPKEAIRTTIGNHGIPARHSGSSWNRIDGF